VDDGVKSFYVEEDDRSAGIKVYPAGDPAIQAGDRVNVTGTLDVDANGEVCLKQAAVEIAASGTVVPLPLGQNNRALLTGLDSTGLLVRCWGTVRRIAPPYFWLDDGTNYRESDQSEPGIRVMGECPVQPGGFVQVTAIRSMLRVGDGLTVPLLRMRSASDAVPLD